MGEAAEIERKFWTALTLFGILGLAVWFTLGPGKIPVLGREVDIRAIPLFAIAIFAFRTVMARAANRIRQDAERSGGQGKEDGPG